MPAEKEKMLAGGLYHASDPQLLEDRARALRLTYEFNQSHPDDLIKRVQILRSLFGKLGENFEIQPSFRCDYGYNIHIGDYFLANYNCVILDVCRVDIGNRVLFGPGVQIYTAAHPLDPALRASSMEFGKPVKIGDNVWIGGGAIVLPGVTIGDNSVIGAGSVVDRDIPDNVIAAGNRCRVIGEIGD
ncbi:MAG: sugar O-acetyltransferase [Brevinematales bacterium]|nr:sugar O-acetyltransferase [Brevinematales bacterium]